MRRGTPATEGAWQNRGSPPRSKDETGSRQLIEQRLGILQDRRAEAFGEPAVDRGEQVTGLGAFALVAPEPGEAGGGAQLPKFGVLPLRHSECLVVAVLRCGGLLDGQQERPPPLM